MINLKIKFILLFQATLLLNYASAKQNFITKNYILKDRLDSVEYHLPNGYSLIQKKDYGEYRKENMSIFKDNKEIYKDDNYHILIGLKGKSLWQWEKNTTVKKKDIIFDINSDGVPKFLYQSQSEGNHGSVKTVLFSLKKDKLEILATLNLTQETITFKDINGDKIPEITFHDDAFFCFGSFSCAGSPWIEVILELKDGHYQYAESLMKKKKLEGTIEAKSANSWISYLVKTIYQGKYKRGMIEVHKSLKGGENIFKKRDGTMVNWEKYITEIRIPEIVEVFSNSPYWKNIKNINGWNGLSLKEITRLLLSLTKTQKR